MSSYNASRQTNASAECPENSSSDVIRQLQALGVWSDEISTLPVEQQKDYLDSFSKFPYGSFPSGQGQAGTVEQHGDVYEEHFFDGEFADGYERKLRLEWLASPSAQDREAIALKVYRKFCKLKEDAELTEFIVGELRPFAQNEQVQEGWASYMKWLS